MTILRNQNRPSVWEQVVAYIQENDSIRNAEVRKLLDIDDTLTASKQLKAWVEQGLLIVANPEAGRNVRRYTLLDHDSDDDFFSKPDGKELP